MLLSLLALTVLAADPVAASTSTAPTAGKSTEANRPRLELVIPEQMLEDFLEAAAPIRRTATQKLEVLGMTQSLEFNLTLTHPRVKVKPKGVFVTMDYDLRGSGGFASNGRATSRLDLRVVPDKNVIEGRLLDTQLSGTDLTIGLDELLEPILIPAGASGPLELGDNQVIATGRTREIVLEQGLVRIRGDWEFKKPSKSAASKDAQ